MKKANRTEKKELNNKRAASTTAATKDKEYFTHLRNDLHINTKFIVCLFACLCSFARVRRCTLKKAYSFSYRVACVACIFFPLMMLPLENYLLFYVAHFILTIIVVGGALLLVFMCANENNSNKMEYG